MATKSLDSYSFVGREKEQEELWTALETGHRLIVGPRRIGKSELVKRVCADGRSGWRAVRVDLESESTVEGAVSAVQEGFDRAGIQPSGDAVQGFLERVRSVKLMGSEVQVAGTGEAAPLDRLEALLAGAAASLDDSERLALFLDEVPWWLDEVRQVEGDRVARRALARLRRGRQPAHLGERRRMVLMGSVGLAGLCGELHAAAEINDLQPALEVGPLDPGDGSALYEIQLSQRGHGVSERAAEHAHRWAGGSPHWIKQIAAKTQPSDPRVRPEDVDQAVDRLLSPRNRSLFEDEGHDHFARRHPRRARVLQAVLDHAADLEGDLPVQALVTAALAADPDGTRRQAEEAVHLLCDDFYLERQGDRCRFVNPLFQAWWQRYGGGR